MKKLHVFLAFVLMSTTIFAQTRNLRNADNELRRGRLDRAVTAIRLAMEEPENQRNSNAWLSQARVFTAVATSENLAFTVLEPNAINLAFESFKRAFELDQTGGFVLLSHQDLSRLGIASYNMGTVLYNQQNFAEAANAFMLSVETSAFMDVVDTNAIFNTALCASAAGDTDLARRFYRKLVDMGADQPAAYIALAVIYKDEKDFATAGKLADMAAELFPNDYSAMINAASIHLMIESSERASQILAVMAEQYSDNPIVFFAKGVALDQINMSEEAEQAYLRAIELRPDYFDAVFNLAAHYVTRGVAIRMEADNLPWNEQRKHAEMTELSNTIFRKAIPMLEKALEIQPNNIPVMTTLRDIYLHLRMDDRATEIMADIEKLEN